MNERQLRARSRRQSVIVENKVSDIIVGILFIGLVIVLAWVTINITLGAASNRPCVTGTPEYRAALHCESVR